MSLAISSFDFVLSQLAASSVRVEARYFRMSASYFASAKRFKHQPNVEAKWVELTKVDTWRREGYIKESGFATPPGSTSPNFAVADACADALSKIIAMQAPAAK